MTYKNRVDIWQYTSRGQMDGITGKCDMNKILNTFDGSSVNNQNLVDNVDNYVEKEIYCGMRKYQNGSTIEPVFSDTNLKHAIGYLNKYEECDCLGVQNNRPMVLYKVNGTNEYKIGFVNWKGGIV